ncbi:MAG: phospholipid carrier-dependent glycosyltransferase [Clostridiales bacterium]|nr:phospholipid carrier-dependent glycosyltransferase [Clostridiales bacterium]
MFRRFLLLMAALLLIAMPLGTADEETNLLKNPGFEELTDAGMPVGWQTDAYVTREGITSFSVTGDAQDGEHAALIESYDMNDARFAQTVKVKPNAMYRLSGWIKASEIPDAGRGANLSVEGVYVFSDSFYETEGEWVYVETYGLTSDDQTELTIFARLGGYSGESQGAAAFDNLSLVKVDELPEGIFADAWYADKQAQAVQPVDDTETGEAKPFWPWLIVIALCYAAVAICLMALFQSDQREAAHLERIQHKAGRMPAFAIIGLCIAALARILVALRVDGYQVDVNCFTAWGNTMAKVGPGLFYQSNWCDYVPGYIYVMGLNGLVAQVLQGIVSPAFVHKLIPMTCDLLSAWMVYHLAVEHEYTRRQAGVFALLMAFNPAVFLNSAAWCQIDSVLCVGLMLVAYFAVHRQWTVVLPLYVLCILMKPQALMLGFLGLSALIMEWVRHPATDDEGRRYHRDMLIGLGISAAVALVIILPFCFHQTSPLWLYNLYQDTLASYPYATLNTANLFYLFDGNWDSIANPASTGACLFFADMAAAWGVYAFIRQRGRQRAWFLEPILMAVYALVYLVLGLVVCTWLQLGVVTMSMAFALVLPMYIRSGKLAQLPLCGAVLFLLLYVFGIKMHERYLFPAIFLLGMAYAIRRDRRILGLLIGASCMLFINEGVVLDNSLRLGATMGHLNADNRVLAICLSLCNVGIALTSVWTCHRICVEDAQVRYQENQSGPVYQEHPCTPLTFQGNAKLGLRRVDALLILGVTLVYSLVTLTTLGSTKAPQKPWKSTAPNEYVYIDLGQHYDDFSMLYFCQVSYSNFAVAVSDDMEGQGWSADYPAQMEQGQCFQWKYLKRSYISNGSPVFVDASTFADVQKLSGRYVRINPMQVGLVINELIFKDTSGQLITGATVVGRENANESSPLYSAPEHLLDEQDTLEGEPGWWNSTYFDEIYHARTAFEHTQHTNAYEWTHPPLGKIIMSWFVALFGMTPFGWRFGGALCGILMLPAMYLLVKQLTKRTDMAFTAMLLMTLDCMHLTQTQLATIDSYPVLFIMLSYFFMLRFMQRDIVLEDVKRVLPDLTLSGFFMGCSIASKWIGVYAGAGLAVLYFWTCFRHLRLGRMAASMLQDGKPYTPEALSILERREKKAFPRFVVLCLWCLLFFVAVPLVIYLLSYTVHFSDRHFNSLWDFLKTVYNTNFGKYNSMMSYHSTPGLGMDHFFYSPWYEWPLMMKPMYYASAAFTPAGKTYAIFCFGNPWVWVVGIGGILYTAWQWGKGHRYTLAGSEGPFHVHRDSWDVAPAFILVGLLAQFLPWVLVPRGTYIYHYFASVPFLILGTMLMLHHFTLCKPRAGKIVCIVYLALCLIWFILLFPYASGVMTPTWWMDAIRDYPYIPLIPDYWKNGFLKNLSLILEKIPILPNVYHH